MLEEEYRLGKEHAKKTGGDVFPVRWGHLAGRDRGARMKTTPQRW